MSAIDAPVSRPTTCINVGDIIIDVASTLVRGIETDLKPREFELADGFRRSISRAIETRVFSKFHILAMQAVAAARGALASRGGDAINITHTNAFLT